MTGVQTCALPIWSHLQGEYNKKQVRGGPCGQTGRTGSPGPGGGAAGQRRKARGGGPQGGRKAGGPQGGRGRAPRSRRPAVGAGGGGEAGPPAVARGEVGKAEERARRRSPGRCRQPAGMGATPGAITGGMPRAGPPLRPGGEHVVGTRVDAGRPLQREPGDWAIRMTAEREQAAGSRQARRRTGAGRSEMATTKATMTATMTERRGTMIAGREVVW